MIVRIAFWSNVHGQTATTSNLVAISLMTAMEYRLKVLLAHNHFEKSTLESSLLDRGYLDNEQAELSEHGIDALARFIKSNNLDKDNISNYTTSILSKKLELIMGTSHTNRDLYMTDLNNVMHQILDRTQAFYDVIFVDVSSGNNELSSKILENSDFIVVNLSQNINVIDDFFKSFKGDLGKCIFVIGRYDANSKFNKKNVMRKYGIKRNLCVVPYNIEFSDACSEGRGVDFILKNLRASRDDVNFGFMEEVRNSVKLILTVAGVDVATKKLGG